MSTLKVVTAAVAAAMVGLAYAGASGGHGKGGAHGAGGGHGGGKQGSVSAGASSGNKSAGSSSKADSGARGSQGSASHRKSSDGNRCMWLMGAEREREGCPPDFEPATRH